MIAKNRLSSPSVKMQQIALLLGLTLVCLVQAKSATHPNIIFLFADDQRADTVGAHGNPNIQTPNLDRLAESGFSFRRNYCAGSFSGAVCVVSRAMLMTGRHWMRLPRNKPQSNWGAPNRWPLYCARRGNTRLSL